MELNSARKLHRVEKDNDEAVFNTNSWTFHIYKYPAVGEPDKFTITAPISAEEGDETDSNVLPSDTNEASAAVQIDTTSTAATLDSSVPVTPQDTLPPSTKDEDTSPGSKSSDLSLQHDTDDEDQADSSVPRTRVIQPSSPSKVSSPPPGAALKFSDIARLTDMDVDSAGHSTDELPDTLEKLTTTCTFYMYSLPLRVSLLICSQLLVLMTSLRSLRLELQVSGTISFRPKFV